MIIETEFVPWCKQWRHEWSSRLCTQFKQLQKRSPKKVFKLQRDSNPGPITNWATEPQLGKQIQAIQLSLFPMGSLKVKRYFFVHQLTSFILPVILQ